jgi:hypothetical protein
MLNSKMIKDMLRTKLDTLRDFVCEQDDVTRPSEKSGDARLG